MVIIDTPSYLDAISKFGISGAHPGGFNLTMEILKDEGINENSRILDVGCGTGQTAAYLSSHYGAKVTGVDTNPIMIEKAKNRMAANQLPVDIIQCSIEDCPLKDEQFDFILSESVLSFANKPKSLSEIHRLLKNGGRFILNELTVNQQLSKADEEEVKQFYGFDSTLTETEWVHFIEQSGFKNIQISNKNTSMLENDSLPEFIHSGSIDPQVYWTLNQHFFLMLKYEDMLGFRIYSCSKEA